MKHTGKSVGALILTILFVVGLLPLGALAADLKFTDVPADKWYYNDVKTAVDSGLVNGKTTTTYCPDDNLTYAEAVKLAACMYQKHTTGVVSLVNGDPWYKSYADFAKMYGIIRQDYAWNDNATRAGYMAIFAYALPEYALAAKNTVPDGSIPDVPMTHPQAQEIYKLYRAGILEGSADQYNGKWTEHLCKPSDTIQRSEVAAILTRMMFVDQRKTFSMGEADPGALKIKTQPQSYSLKAAEETVSFTVEIEGGKAPYTYKWVIEKETGTNPTSGSSEKTTSAFQVSVKKDSYDFSKYIRVYVVVTDSAGKTVTSEKAEILPFAADLKIAKQPVAYAMKTADDTGAAFTVEISGGRAPYKYEWIEELDGVPTWYNTAEGVQETKHTFPVKDAAALLKQAKMVRVYCVITDSDGKKVTSEKAELKAFSLALNIKTQPKSAEAAPGGSHTFNVEVTGGKEPYTYEWQYRSKGSSDVWKPYQDIYNGKNTIAFAGITKMDYGYELRCVIKDADGNTVISNVVWLIEPANSLKATVDSTAITLTSFDQTFHLTCSATGGTAPYSYQWWWGSEEGKLYDMSGWSSEYDEEYIYAKPDPRYGVQYMMCRVTDKTGAFADTAVVKITVNVSVPELTIKTQPKDFQMENGYEKPVFTVEVTGGVAPYTYTWHEDLNFTQFTVDGGTSNSTQNSLTVTDANNMINQADYNIVLIWCEIEDGNHNKVKSSGAMLTQILADDLKISIQPSDQSAGIGETVTFMVSAIGGYGKYTYDWMTNPIGEQQQSVASALNGKDSLTIVVDFYDYEYEYTCCVKDEQGNYVFSRSARVYKPVSISTPTSSYTVAKDKSITISPTVSGGTGTYKYYWYYNGATTPISDFSQTSYTVNGGYSTGTRTLKLVVEDSLSNRAEYTWTITVTN